MGDNRRRDISDMSDRIFDLALLQKVMIGLKVAGKPETTFNCLGNLRGRLHQKLKEKMSKVHLELIATYQFDGPSAAQERNRPSKVYDVLLEDPGEFFRIEFDQTCALFNPADLETFSSNTKACPKFWFVDFTKQAAHEKKMFAKLE